MKNSNWDWEKQLGTKPIYKKLIVFNGNCHEIMIYCHKKTKILSKLPFLFFTKQWNKIIQKPKIIQKHPLQNGWLTSHPSKKKNIKSVRSLQSSIVLPLNIKSTFFFSFRIIAVLLTGFWHLPLVAPSCFMQKACSFWCMEI